MGRFRLLAIDVDGTLTDRSDRVRPAVRAALHEAVARGVTVVIATGRAPHSTRWALDDLGLDLPAVMANGALLTDGLGLEPFERRLLEPAAVRELIGVHRAAGYEPMVYDDPAIGHRVVYERDHPLNEPYVSRYPQRMLRVDQLAAWLDHPVLVTVAFCEHEQAARRFAAQLNEALGERVGGQALWHPKYDDWMVETSAPGCTKWSGILRFAERRGIEPDEILAIGDGLNDLPMIRGAGWGVAMGNADAEVLAAADEVVADNEHDGVAEVVRRHILGQRTEAA